MGVYKIDNHIKCENCRHPINPDEFSYKLRSEYQNVYAKSKWGPKSFECPECQHLHNSYRKPFHKMNIIDKGWTLFYLLFYAFCHNVPYGIAGAIMFSYIAFFVTKMNTDEYNLWLPIYAGLIIGIIPDSIRHVIDFFESDKFLK